MHVLFRPMGGNTVGMLPQPAISQMEAQIFGRRSMSGLDAAFTGDDILQSIMFSRHLQSPRPVILESDVLGKLPIANLNPGVFGFAARH